MAPATSSHCNLHTSFSVRRIPRTPFLAYCKVPAFMEFRSNAEADAVRRFLTPVSSTEGSIQVETAKIKASRRGRVNKFANPSKVWSGAELALGRAVSSFGVSNETFRTFGKIRMSELNSGRIIDKSLYKTSKDSEAARDQFPEKMKNRVGRMNTNITCVVDVSCSDGSDSLKIEIDVQKGKAKDGNSGSEMAVSQKKVSKMTKGSISNATDSQSRQHVGDSLVSQAGSDLEMNPESDREKSMAMETKGKDLALKINSENKRLKSASTASKVSKRKAKSNNDIEDVQCRKQASEPLKNSTTKPLEVISEYKADNRIVDQCFEGEAAESDKHMKSLNEHRANSSNRPEIGKASNRELEKETVEGFKFQRKRASGAPTSNEKHFLEFENIRSRYLDDGYPLVVEEEDPDWPDEGEAGWGFRLDSFFNDIKIVGEKGEKTDQGDGDESDVDLEEEDDEEWLVKGITSMEWEETVFGDPQPLVVLVYTRHGHGWSTNWHMLQELEKSVKFLWESRRFALRAAKVDGRLDKDLASVLKINEFPTLLFIKGGKLLHHLCGFKRSEEILDFIAHFFFGGPRPTSLNKRS